MHAPIRSPFRRAHVCALVFLACLWPLPAAVAFDLQPVARDLAVPLPDGQEHAARARAVEAVMVSTHPGFPSGSPGARELCDWLAYWVEAATPAAGEGRLSAKYHDIGVANFNTWSGVLERLHGIGLPAGVVESWSPVLAADLIRWRIPLDTGPWLREVEQAAPGATVWQPGPSDLIAALKAAQPDLARLPDAALRRVMDRLAALNPGFDAARWVRGPTYPGPGPAVKVTVGDGKGTAARTYRYGLRPGPVVVIPGPAALRDWAIEAAKEGGTEPFQVHAPAPANWWRVECPGAVPGSPARDLRLFVVREGRELDAVAQLSGSGELIRLNLVAPAASAAAGERPTLPGDPVPAPSVPLARVPEWVQGSRDEPAWPRTLREEAGRWKGTLRIPMGAGKRPRMLELELDVVPGAQLAGRFISQLVDDRGRTQPGATGEVSGGPWMPGTDPVAGPGWPQMHGPENTGAAVPSASPLIADPAQARLEWLSAERLPVGEWSDMRSVSPPGEPILGGFASPVVADGRAFLFYYRPTPGGVRWEARAREHAAKGGWPERYSIEADDVVMAWDARTGRALWKTIFPSAGINRGSMHKNGFMGTPAVHEGRLVVRGTAGKVWCLDAATGQVLWESDIGMRARQLRAIMSERIRSREIFSANRDFNRSPLVVDGVVVVSDEIHASDSGGFRYEIQDGLIGLDLRDGRPLWRVPECNAGRANHPAIWRGPDGKSYVLAADTSGLRCIDPVSGRVLWHREGVTNEMGWLAVAGDILVAHGKAAGRDGEATSVQGWRLSVGGADRIWELPAATHGRAMGGFAVHRGHAWFVSAVAKKLVCVEPGTGKVIAESAQETGLNGEHDNALVVGMGDWILTSNGRERDGFRVWSADPAGLRPLGLFAQPITGGYCAAVQPALADGRMFVRLQNRLACFDVRAVLTRGR